MMKRPLMLKQKSIVSLATISVAIIWSIFTSSCGSKIDASRFRTAKVIRGSLSASVNATGTLEPEEVVDVGAQVAGRIDSFGKGSDGNPIDFGSSVEAGALLAHIDDTVYKAELSQAEAQKIAADASVAQARAKLSLAESNWKRSEALINTKAMSKSSVEESRSALEVAKADLMAAEAAVTQAEASVSKAQRNLEFCTIRSPVAGVIIDRRVNVGQTVVSSLNAPSLFLMGTDLSKLTVWASVNEADIGHIKAGQKATFTVATFPGDTFEGEVTKIRLNASVSQNVVTYIVEISVHNSQKKLIPYLTASVKFDLGSVTDALLVPLSATHYTPQDSLLPTGWKQPSLKGDDAIVWQAEPSGVRPVQIKTALRDSAWAEVREGGLHENDEVVIGEVEQTGEASGVTNPFAPRMPRGRSTR